MDAFSIVALLFLFQILAHTFVLVNAEITYEYQFQQLLSRLGV